MKKIIYIATLIALYSCEEKLNLTPILPDVITETTINDTDDPAIWVNPIDASKSIIFGTDKETNGAIYAFDLDGKIIEEKTIRNIERPNNVDLTYGFTINDSTKVDIIAFTEREKNQVRVFSVPDMKPLDNGGFKVFEEETNLEFKAPMGIAIYHSPVNQKVYFIVGRKTGPKENYLYQYELQATSEGVKMKLARKFGNFSGKKEIEAIAVDNEMGYIYYSDEQHGIRKYYAEPEKGNQEVAIFGMDKFASDIEGIAIAKTASKKGYIIVSDQQRGQFNVFDRETNAFIKAVNLTTTGTDGCDVVTSPLGSKYPKGLFVAMNDAKNFYFYDFGKIEKEIKTLKTTN
ncbi:phytase [Flavobacterium sp. HNIBRBA15423]|uniref:phytase n=1 Tax=Flavobacterium sp. HNIBRBA15423 TaxID=3458683 RepID=UPI0040448A86